MSAARRDAFSRPVFDQTIRIQSNHAQRLLDRGFLLVVRALYGIDVVLRIIGDDEEMDQVEEIVGSLITELAEELRAERRKRGQAQLIKKGNCCWLVSSSHSFSFFLRGRPLFRSSRR
jgi:hypothetical protein